MRRIAFLTALAILSGRAAAAQSGPGAVDLQVTDAESGGPLAGAQVRLDGEPRGVSDSTGFVRLDGVAPGTHALRVEMIGHAPQEPRIDVSPGTSLALEVVLDSASVAVAPIVATAAAGGEGPGSHPRRAHGSGVVITREQIVASRAGRLSELLRKVPGVRVQSGPGGPVAMLPSGNGTEPSLGPGRDGSVGARCVAQLVLDGVVLPTPSLDAVALQELESVEVYLHVVPGEYNGTTAACGVIALHTRTR
jgi:hypothetical protein